MSDSSANQHADSTQRVTIADVLRDLEPMGNLDRFAIDDLTPEEDDAFFAILETL